MVTETRMAKPIERGYHNRVEEKGFFCHRNSEAWFPSDGFLKVKADTEKNPSSGSARKSQILNGD